MTAKVLVVDDVRPNIKLLEAKLTSEYYDVLTAMNGEEALEIIHEELPDIVLLDVMMPGMDGFEVCRRIKADPKVMHIPVVMVTALDQTSDRVTGLTAGADDFLTKPVNDIALMARVKSLVRLKMMMDELRMREATGANLGMPDEGDSLNEMRVEDANILIVEDNGRIAEQISKSLEESGDVHVASRPEGAADLAITGNFDLVIISLALSDYDGLRICSHLRSVEETRQIPLLVLVEDGDTKQLVKAMDLGVNDYLVRPVDHHELLARAHTQLRRKRYADRLRNNLHLSMQMAVTDAVTGLYNRHYLASHLDTVMGHVRQDTKTVSAMMLDIDFFKKVNDEHGHKAGDEVLREFANRIAMNIRGVDLASRYGGEEFVVIMPDTDLALAQSVAERLRQQVEEEPFSVSAEAGQINVTVSIGLSTSEDGICTSDDLLKIADEALYKAKEGGRNQVVIGHPESVAE